MNQNRAFIMLGAFYSLLILIGVIALFSGGGSMLVLAQLAVGAIAVTGLWGYILKRGFMSPRVWRPLSYFLAVAVVLQVIVLFTTHPSSALISQLLIGTVFSALLVSILYQYGNRDQDLWNSPDEVEGGKVLSELLSKHQELVVEKQQANRQALVNVSRVDQHYLASVVRGVETKERFEERFTQPSTLAFFIERYTCISVGDFARKYANNTTLAQ
ncbi:MAG TPA: hypothetical protein VFM75_09160 [Modicisalibacter sp.]|nr:hypothetical protein [Modicisalibacter sp.]